MIATGRQWLFGSLVATMLIAMVALFYGARHTTVANRWPIRWVEVESSFARVSAEQIRATAAPLLGGGFFGIALDDVRRQVESLPWVRAVEVRKRWPETILLRVTEHQPLARWGEDRLVSDVGEVFAVVGGDRIQGLVRLAGPDENASEVVELYHASRLLLAGTGFDVVALQLTGRGAWRAELSGGLEVAMGSDQPLDRLARLVAALGDLVAEPSRQPAHIDLRYTNGFAVKWRATTDVAIAAISGGADAAAP